MRAFLALGSNRGDRAAHIAQAVALLRAVDGIEVIEQSRLYETEPVGMRDGDADWFVNAALAIETKLSPEQLLAACLAAERQLGRERPAEGDQTAGYAARTVDIDILFYGDQVLDTPTLTIPHPRLHQRAFMLVPMLELAAEWRHPVFNQPIHQLHLALPEPAEVLLLGTRLTVPG